jgi:4-hydroxybenzoate polyprenyltransferase
MADTGSMNKEPVLCVDLDGTLVHTDLLYESLLALLRQSPLLILLVPLWLLRGRAHLKHQLASRVQLDYAGLPRNLPLIELLRQERSSGRHLALVTASPQAWADAMAAQLGLFDEVLASSEHLNLGGRNKAAALVRRFGARGYDYAGDGRTDLPVWASARQGWAVNTSNSTLRQAKGLVEISRTLNRAPTGFLTYIRAIRLHQWLKNMLVFMPLLAAHRVMEPGLALNALVMFLAFGLCASSGYVLNDLLDLPADRIHPRKRYRPLASGALPLLHGLVLVPSLLGAGVALVLCFLSPMSLALLLTYYLGTVTYSMALKSMSIVDVVALATLYTLRILAGAAATHIVPSFWLLAFSMFLFLSLAVVKRYSEVLGARARGEDKLRGRGYIASDDVLLSSMGVASGYMSVLVLALYVNSAPMRELYRRPEVIWLLCPLLLFWITRIWFKTHRGQMHDDPLVYAATDRFSWVVASVSALCLWLAA